MDSYSAFYDNGGFTETELSLKLNQRDIDTVYISGLALDFCVFYSAMDANHLEFKTFVIQDATRGITPDGVAEALQQMTEAGISIIQSGDLEQILRSSAMQLTSSKMILIFGILVTSILNYS